MIDYVREGEEEALRYLEGIWQNRLATFMQNDGNINVRDDMRRNPQSMVNLARGMFGVQIWSTAHPIFFLVQNIGSTLINTVSFTDIPYYQLRQERYIIDQHCSKQIFEII